MSELHLFLSKAFISFLVLSLCLLTAKSQDPLIINTHNRQTKLLNGYWKYIVDPYENGFYNYRYEPFDKQKNPSRNAFFMNAERQGPADLIEYDFNKSDSIKIPGDWNSQKEKLYYYEGSVWFKKSFDYTVSKSSNRVFIYFGASNYQTDVYFNGKKLGRHVGGFTPFNFEITELLKQKDNFLIVKVDNKRNKDAVPTLNTDWWNYGGLTRDVKLIETSGTFVEDYFVQLDPENTEVIKGYVKLNGKETEKQPIAIEIPELKLKKNVKTNKDGVAYFEVGAKKISYWSPTSPKLYTVLFTHGSSTLKDQIGFRFIQTKGHSILLNGKSIYLKGVSIHEESPIRGGRGNSREDSKKLLSWAKELGCNYVRLAHYPHNEYMIRLADEMGIMVWEENPVYWTISWGKEETFSNAKQQLSDVITRDKNRASVIIWSMANETPNSDQRNNFLTKLAKHAKLSDPTRLISAALEQENFEGNPNVRTISDPFAEMVDVLSFNQYIGWYDGSVEKARKISWKITQNKPVLISEFGAGAKYGLHGDKGERWTEEYQEWLYEETLKMIDKIDQLRGFSPWVLVDFRSPRRLLPEIQDDYNRKGLISEKGEKKKAYHVLKKFYERKPTFLN